MGDRRFGYRRFFGTGSLVGEDAGSGNGAGGKRDGEIIFSRVGDGEAGPGMRGSIFFMAAFSPGLH